MSLGETIRIMRQKAFYPQEDFAKYYDKFGKQYKQISNNNHGRPKTHPFGEKGEHAHDYIYDDSGELINRPY